MMHSTTMYHRNHLAAFALAALAAACGGNAADPMVAEFATMPADQIMEGVEFSSTTAGVRSSKVLADTAYLYEDSTVMHLRGVDLEMYDATGKRTAHLTSLSGVYDQATQKMVAKGTVVLVIIGDGRRIESEELHYDPQSRRIWSDVQTRMTEADGNVTTAASFNADDQFNNIQFQNARGRVRERIEF